MGVDVEPSSSLSASPATFAGDQTSGQPAQPSLCDVSLAPPEGQIDRTHTVNLGESSAGFQVATPQSYSDFWTWGTPPDELEASARALDPSWVERWEQRLRSGNENPKAIAVDNGRSSEVVAVVVTLTPPGEEPGDALAASFAEGYESVGFPVGEACGVSLDGMDAAYVEHTVPGSGAGDAADRSQLQFLIPDPPHNALWGVTCDAPKALVSEVKRQCLEIASTFRPLR